MLSRSPIDVPSAKISKHTSNIKFGPSYYKNMQLNID